MKIIKTSAYADIAESVISDTGGIGIPPVNDNDNDNNNDYNPQWPQYWKQIEQWFFQRFDKIIVPILQDMVNSAMSTDPISTINFKGLLKSGGMLCRLQFNWTINETKQPQVINNIHMILTNELMASSLREIFSKTTSIAEELEHGLLDRLLLLTQNILAKKLNHYTNDPIHRYIIDFILEIANNKKIIESVLEGTKKKYNDLVCKYNSNDPVCLNIEEANFYPKENFQVSYYNFGSPEHNMGFTFEVSRLMEFRL